MPRPKPIKIPKGTSHAEPSWREALKKLEEEYKAAGGQKGIYQRACADLLQWRGPSNLPPKLLQKDEVNSGVSQSTDLGNARIGKVGVWLQQECLTGQVLFIWIPDVNQLTEKSALRRDFIVEDSTGYRYSYAPKTVMSVLKLGYPVG